MTKKLFTGTTNGLELWVDAQVLESLRQEQENRRRRLHARAGEKGYRLTGTMPRLVDDVIQEIVDSLTINNECWEWSNARSVKGYPVARLFGRYGSNWLVHRFVFMITQNPSAMPPMVCHHCDNPPCCRPDHLFYGNGRLNSDDKIAKGRAHWQKGNDLVGIERAK